MAGKLEKIILLVGALLFLVNSGCLGGGSSGGSSSQYSPPQEQTYTPKPSLKILEYGESGFYVKNSGDATAKDCVLYFSARPYNSMGETTTFDTWTYGNIPGGTSTTGGVEPEFNKLSKGEWEWCRQVKCDNTQSVKTCGIITL